MENILRRIFLSCLRTFWSFCHLKNSFEELVFNERVWLDELCKFLATVQIFSFFSILLEKLQSLPAPWRFPSKNKQMIIKNINYLKKSRSFSKCPSNQSKSGKKHKQKHWNNLKFSVFLISQKTLSPDIS